MRVMLNGEPREFERSFTVASLIEALKLDVGKVAVERNLEIVPRSLYLATSLSENDRIEIVHFIGGG